MKSLMSQIFLILVLVVTSFACSPTKKTPEAKLREFLEMSFEHKLNRNELPDYVGGEFYTRLTKMTDDEFKKAFDTRDAILSNVELFSVVCKNDHCMITFAVNYKEGVEVRTSTKKVAELFKGDDGWRIADISHIKTTHDFQQNLEILR